MRALIVVDMQNDFMPNGSLPVSKSLEIVPLINRLMDRFDFVVATQDWHPKDHVSFASNHPKCKAGDVIDGQRLWPQHCVQNTYGAEFAPNLATERFDFVVHKGSNPKIDSYSAFFDNAHLKKTDLAPYLLGKGVSAVYFVGVALDVCVLYSALDALELGFASAVITDACRGIDEEGVEKALSKMRERGVRLLSSNQVQSL